MLEALLVLSLSFHVLTLWLLWSHLQIMQRVQQALHVWDRPEHLTTPAPEPGTSWVPSESEQSAQEAQWQHDSAQRASRPGWHASRRA